jgi:hypothetical protein
MKYETKGCEIKDLLVDVIPWPCYKKIATKPHIRVIHKVQQLGARIIGHQMCN